MSDRRFNLLDEPLINIRTATAVQRACSLPQLLAMLSNGEVAAYLALRPHQSHGWHAFLVQISALAMHRAGVAGPTGDANTWREWLLALGGGDDGMWCLFVADLARPALLQPSVPEGTLAAFKKVLATPDALDVLITTKNHDLKAECIRQPEPEHWLFSLVALQTMGGFFGAGNYGIARMNGGFSNRPCMAIVQQGGQVSRVMRDAAVLLAHHDSVAEAYGYQAAGGLALLWSLPWDGQTSLSLAKCDPYFVEVCRRVRFVVGSHGLQAMGCSSQTSRVEASHRKGNLGDPWTPIKKADGTALTVSEAGLTYALMQELLLGSDHEVGIAQRVGPEDRDPLALYAWAMVRGQGKTAGLHERFIPLPVKIRFRFGSPEARNSLAELAKARVAAAGTMRAKVLRPALCAALQAGVEDLDFRDERSQRWLEAFERSVDEAFFPELWVGAELGSTEAREAWAKLLDHLARAQLDLAFEGAAIRESHRYRAIQRALGLYWALLRKHFPECSPSTSEGAMA